MMTPDEMRRAADLFDADAAELRLERMGADGEWLVDDDGYTDRAVYDELSDLCRKLRAEADAREPTKPRRPVETCPHCGGTGWVD